MKRKPIEDFRSESIKVGEAKISSRSLMKGAGLTDEEIARPFIGVCNSYSNFFPGHSNLDKIGQAVKDGIYMGGGTPVEFSTIGICDGIAMGTPGMKYSLPAASSSPTAWRPWPRPMSVTPSCSSAPATRSSPA